MPAYLVAHAKSHRGDMLIEDQHLTLNLAPGWVAFSDQTGIVLALPAEQVASIQRVDGPQDQEPAPEE